jgi:hypothetical protein
MVLGDRCLSEIAGQHWFCIVRLTADPSSYDYNVNYNPNTGIWSANAR